MAIVTTTTKSSLANKSLDPRDRLAVALDFPTLPEALALASRLEGTVRWMKVGMELYYAAGNAAVVELRARGFEVFLDLKLHDIPNTVAGGVRSAARAGAGILNVHASGGEAMMRAAAEAVAELAAAGQPSPRLIAVTVLTSFDAAELHQTGVYDHPSVQVARLAELAKASGINGLVCSAEEVAAMRRLMGSDAILVTPGIRPTGSDAADQRRIATPADAIRNGASMLVVGRPITQAPDPVVAAAAILREIEEAR